MRGDGVLHRHGLELGAKEVAMWQAIADFLDRAS
jgi:hypothetical protein